MSPLYKLTSRKIPFEWTEVHQSAFEEIVTQLATYPGIAHYDKEKPVTLVTDASGHAVGGTLYQAGRPSELHIQTSYNPNELQSIRVTIVTRREL